jgi:hypothetical protein
LTIQEDNPGSGGYGSLEVNGSMSWTGGTFVSYVNGGTAGQQTQLIVDFNLTLAAGAHLQINSVGALTSNRTWTPIRYRPDSLTGTLTFDSGAQFTISYATNGQINVTSR